MKQKWLFPHISSIQLKNSPIGIDPSATKISKYFHSFNIDTNQCTTLYCHCPVLVLQYSLTSSEIRAKLAKLHQLKIFVNMSTNNLSTSKRRIDAISSVFICFTYFFHFLVRLDAIYQVVSRVCGLCQNCRNVSEMTFLLTFAYTNWLSAYRNRSSCKHIFQMKISHSVLIRFWWNKPFMKAIS
jgi:hypothetical protein